MAPDLELINACFARMRTDAGVTAVLPAASIFDRVPEKQDGSPNVASPYISCDYTSILPDDADCIPGVEIEFQIDAWSWGSGEAYSSAQVRKIADAVRRCLHNAEIVLTVNALASLEHILNASEKASSFEGVGNETKRAVDTAQAFVAEQQRLNGLTTEQLALETEISRVKSEAERGDVVLTEQQALDIAKQRLAAEERRSQIKADTKSGVKEADEAKREAEAVLELIAALEFERQTLGLSAEDQAVANALRQAGAAATDEQRVKIEELVRANLAEAEAIDANKEAMEGLQDIAQNAFSSFLSDLRQGKSAAEALGNVFDNLAAKLIDIAAQKLIAAAFGGLFGGGGATGGASSVTSLIPGLGGIGHRARGGPVTAGRPYIVGEERPELFVPNTSGTIVPRVPGAGQQRVVNNVYNYGNDKVEQRQNSTGGIDVIIGAAVQKMEKNMASGKYRPLGVGPGLKRS